MPDPWTPHFTATDPPQDGQWCLVEDENACRNLAQWQAASRRWLDYHCYGYDDWRYPVWHAVPPLVSNATMARAVAAFNKEPKP